MLLPRSIVLLFPAAMMALGAGLVFSQNYPVRPIRIATTEAGGGSDFAARLIAPALTSSLGQRVIVDNRPTTISIEVVAKAPPNGYTLLLGSMPLWVEPLLHDVSFDPLRDFAPITSAVRAPTVLVVYPSLAVKSVKELIDFAKTAPGTLNYASAGTGGVTHLAPELFKALAGVNIVRVNYKGAGPALTGILTGEVNLMFPTAGSAARHIESGRLRALAISTAQPSPLFPGLPTVAATVPGYEMIQRAAFFAPIKTPASIIRLLNAEIVRVLNGADLKEKFFNAGVETIGDSPEQLGITIRSEMARIGKLIAEAGIRD